MLLFKEFIQQGIETVNSVKLLSEVDGEEKMVRQLMKIISLHKNDEARYEDLVECII